MDLAVFRPVEHQSGRHCKSGLGSASSVAGQVRRPLCLLALGVVLAGCVAPANDPAAGTAPILAVQTNDPLIAFLSDSAPVAVAAPAAQQPGPNGVLEPYRATLDRILGAEPQANAPSFTPALAPAPSARFRIVRSYAAASGAECREVEESSGAAVERLRLVCREPSGVWREARPLLSSVSQRP